MVQSSLIRIQLLERLEELNGSLEELIRNLDAFDHELLNKQPSPGQWSVLQTLQHLMNAEKSSLGYLRKKLSFNPVLEQKTLGTSIRSMGLLFFLYAPIKFKSPDFINPFNNGEEMTLNEIALDWRAVRRELRIFLEMVDEDIFDKEVFKHSFSGKLTLRQMMGFFRGHFSRHRKQINLTLERVRK